MLLSIKNLLLVCSISALPSNSNRKSKTNSTDTSLTQLDSRVADAIGGDGGCKVSDIDYAILGCGIQQSTLKQGVTFCFSGKIYLLLCNDPLYCDNANGKYGQDIRTKTRSDICSNTPPYYGASTTNF